MEAFSTFSLLSDTAGEFVSAPHKLFVGGQWIEAGSGERFDVDDPATGQVVASVPMAGPIDVDRAVGAARVALETGPWGQMPGAERGRLIWALAERIAALSDELAEIEAVDAGKSLTYAKLADLPLTQSLYRYFSGWASKITGQTLELSRPGEYHAYTLREPVGVVGLITPWNFPLVLTAYKLAPALAAGCTVVLKPAEQTPLSALRLAQIIEEVGFPPGVVNVLTGDGATGAALVAHPGVDKISFTGSGEVGKLIVQSAARDLKRVSLELGGKSPMFVFPDADLDVAIPGVASAIFFHQGQVCTAGSRVYAHRKVYDKLVAGIAEVAAKIRPDHGLKPGVEMGPLVSLEQLERVNGYVQAGRAEGAELVVGGERLDMNGGYFFKPTVFAATSPAMSIVREEIFGPVLCAAPFDDEDLDQLAKTANASPLGLAASVWTRDLSTAHRMARRIKAGTVWINAHNLYDPNMAFGGYKQSGWGRECGYHAIESFTEVKSVIAPL